MESNQGSEICNNGLKQEVMVFPGMKNAINDGFSGVKENVVPVVGSVGDTKENGNIRDDKVGCLNTSSLMCSVVCDKVEELKEKGAVCVNRKSNDGDERSKIEFLVGDLVWCKLENQPWWPGLIYNPADASDMASRFKVGDKLLVGFFGDSSAAWCSTSQLIPFVEHFEEMCIQGTSESFVKAVGESLGELGRRVELKLISSCVPEGNRTDLARPEARNAAVRPGTFMPDGAVDKVPSPWCEPAEFLSYLKNVGVAGPSSLLKLALMKSWLACYSRVQRGCPLIIYQEPQIMEGLEDRGKDAVLNTNGVTVPIQGLCVTELMGEDKVELKGKKKCKIAEKTPSTTARKRKATSDDYSNERGVQQASAAGRMTGEKKIDNSDSLAIVVHDGFQIERVDDENTQAIVVKKDEDPVTDKQTQKRYVFREKKNSKFLREPYFDPSLIPWRSISKKKLETKCDKIVKSADVGDRLTKVGGQLVSSPSLMNCSGAVSHSKKKKKLETKCDKIVKYANVGDRLAKVAGQLISSPRKCNSAVSKEELSVANSQNFIGVNASPTRNSTNSNISSYKLCNDQNSSKIRKSSVCAPRDLVIDLNNTADVSAQPAAQSQKIDKPRSRVTKLKKAARAAATSTNEVEKTAPVALIVSFDSEAYLPSKDEIIKTFSNFGSINEGETKLLHDSNCAQVVFNNTSNAELAFKESIKQNPFSGNHVEYNLRYSSDASRALESGKKPSRSPRKRSLKKLVSLQPTDGDMSQVGLVRINLGYLTSMLNQCNGNISVKEKSDLERETRHMLQKVVDLEVKASP